MSSLWLFPSPLYVITIRTIRWPIGVPTKNSICLFSFGKTAQSHDPSPCKHVTQPLCMLFILNAF